MAKKKKKSGTAKKVPNETDPQQAINKLSSERAHVADQLAQLEKQIYNFEGSYVEETHMYGNIIRGWDRSPSSGQSTSSQRDEKLKDAERLISKSSITSASTFKSLVEEKPES